MTGLTQNIRGRFHAWRHCSRGVATVEFAMLSPVLILILAAITDFGLVLHKKAQLDASVSAAANYALLQSEGLSSSNASQLAIKTATVLIGSSSGNTEATVLVNNALKLIVADGKATSQPGVGSADSCYCPVRISDQI